MNRGVVIAVGAYVLWGLSPIYWRLVEGIPAGDVIIFRVVMTALLLSVIHLIGRTGPRIRARFGDPRQLAVFALTATLLGTNWLVFVWAVNNERVLDASLGYFINPLVSVLLGVVVLGERLRPASTISVCVAALGVGVLAVDLGTLPWVSLLLAVTFGAYGLLRKTSSAGSLDGLTLEVFVLLPVALGFLVIRGATADGVAGISDPARDLWLIGTGLMTATPLLLFASAARRIELWLVGMLQFIAPTLQFLLGVVVWNESWSGGQAVGFVIIWCALAIFAAEPVIRARRRPRPATVVS